MRVKSRYSKIKNVNKYYRCKFQVTITGTCSFTFSAKKNECPRRKIWTKYGHMALLYFKSITITVHKLYVAALHV